MTTTVCVEPEPAEQTAPRKRATPGRAAKKTETASAIEAPPDASEPHEVDRVVFDPDIVTRMRELAVSGLNPESALRLLTRLMAEVPAATKEIMDVCRQRKWESEVGVFSRELGR